MSTMKTIKVLVAIGLVASAVAVAAACGDDAITETPINRDAGIAQDSGGITNPGADGGTNPGMDGSVIIGPDGAVIDDCVANPNPNVYTDILNACTTSYKIDPKPVLPLLYADGGLPPLP
jgi:hypothetical protein